MTAVERLHVTFSHSAAGSLKQALSRLGVAEKVAALADDLSVGPIEPGDSGQRVQWEDAEFGERLFTDPLSAQLFWSSVTAWPGTLVVWVSSRCGLELCGLHALVSRVPLARIQVVDVAAVNFRKPTGEPAAWVAQSFSWVSDDRIIEHSLIDLASPLDDVSRASLRSRWKQLGRENAALRILTEHGLESKPITFFDERILTRITDDWQSCERVADDTMTSMSTGRLREFSSGDFIFWRLLHFIDNDELEAQNKEDDCSVGQTEVRRWPAGP